MVLVLVQAKFSESIPAITVGLKDLERSLASLASALESSGAEINVENKVLINLRAALNRMSPEARKELRLDFHLLHLSDEDSTVFGQKVREKRTHLKEALEHFFPDRTCTIRAGTGQLPSTRSRRDAVGRHGDAYGLGHRAPV